jgi:hypothetical protein
MLPLVAENLTAFACSIMAQLTLSRFKGETTLNFISRVIASFCGGIVGMTIWYISTGSGQGNPYGLAAACSIFFPVSGVPSAVVSGTYRYLVVAAPLLPHLLSRTSCDYALNIGYRRTCTS